MIFFNTFLGRSSRFFTLVELLVVISIVSILSSIGFSGMQTARAKAIDGGLKETLSSARNQAGIVYSNTGSYGTQATTTGFSIGSSGVFADPKIAEAITAAERLSGGQATYVSNDSFYTLSIPLKADPTKSWCVDSMGNVGVIDGTIDTMPCIAARAKIRSSGGGSGGSPSSSCAASGACAETANGSTCTTYSLATIDSPAPCSSVAVVSTCTNGVWSTPPANEASCTVTNTCIAPDGSMVGHNGTWVGYSTSWVSCGASCPARDVTITCMDGSWSDYAANTCEVAPCDSCLASGGCSGAAHGSSCTTYQMSYAGLPNTCTAISRTSTCNNGSWSSAPYMATTCMVHDWSAGSWGTCTAGNQTRTVVCKTNSGTGATVADMYCNMGTKPLTSRTCCAASGACAAAGTGSTCVTYGVSSASSAFACSQASYTSQCIGSAWVGQIALYASCSVLCPASGGCPSTVSGSSCTSYTASSVTSPTLCSSVVRNSLCAGGSWATTPGAYSSCTQN